MNGGYGAASYQVYLFSKAKNEFVQDASFTELAQFQGMFEVKKDVKMIYVHSKSGCCFHQTDGYKVVNNKPFKVYEHTIDGTVPNGGDDPKIMTKKLVNEKWLTWERASAAKVSFDKGKTSKTISVKLDKNEPVKWFGFGAAKGQILNLTVDSPGADVRIVDFKGDVSSYESYESLQEGKILPAKLTGNGDYYVEISAEQDITVNLTISIKNEKDK